MEKESKLEFKVMQDIIDYINKGDWTDYYIVREFGDEEKHYFEDWSGENSKVIPISEDIFMDCYEKENLFREDIRGNTCSLQYIGPGEED